MKDKLYVVKKFIMAKSVKDVIKKEKKTPIDSVWIDDEWSKGNAKNLADAIGYDTQGERD
jgi:hypothetical protein